MEEGNGVKQRRDEVGSDRETAQTCGPASREEERRRLTSVSSGAEGMERSRAWGAMGLRADQGGKFGREVVREVEAERKGAREGRGSPFGRRGRGKEGEQGRWGEHEEEGQRRHWKEK